MPDIVEVPNPSVPGGKVRVFSDFGIRSAIDKAVAGLPSGKTGAIAAFVDTDKTVKLTAVARLGDHWSIALDAQKPYHKKIEGQAAVVFAW